MRADSIRATLPPDLLGILVTNWQRRVIRELSVSGAGIPGLRFPLLYWPLQHCLLQILSVLLRTFPAGAAAWHHTGADKLHARASRQTQNYRTESGSPVKPAAPSGNADCCGTLTARSTGVCPATAVPIAFCYPRRPRKIGALRRASYPRQLKGGSTFHKWLGYADALRGAIPRSGTE